MGNITLCETTSWANNEVSGLFNEFGTDFHRTNSTLVILYHLESSSSSPGQTLNSSNTLWPNIRHSHQPRLCFVFSDANVSMLQHESQDSYICRDAFRWFHSHNSILSPGFPLVAFCTSVFCGFGKNTTWWYLWLPCMLLCPVMFQLYSEVLSHKSLKRMMSAVQYQCFESQRKSTRQSWVEAQILKSFHNMSAWKEMFTHAARLLAWHEGRFHGFPEVLNMAWQMARNLTRGILIDSFMWTSDGLLIKLPHTTWEFWETTDGELFFCSCSLHAGRRVEHRKSRDKNI